MHWPSKSIVTEIHLNSTMQADPALDFDLRVKLKRKYQNLPREPSKSYAMANYGQELGFNLKKSEAVQDISCRQSTSGTSAVANIGGTASDIFSAMESMLSEEQSEVSNSLDLRSKLRKSDRSLQAANSFDLRSKLKKTKGGVQDASGKSSTSANRSSKRKVFLNPQGKLLSGIEKSQLVHDNQPYMEVKPERWIKKGSDKQKPSVSGLMRKPAAPKSSEGNWRTPVSDGIQPNRSLQNSPSSLVGVRQLPPPCRENTSNHQASNNNGSRVKMSSVPPTYSKFGYKCLKQMVETNNSNEITCYICNNSKVFANLLNEKPRQDILYLIIELIVKSMKTEFRESKIEIYLMVCEKPFVEYLTVHITSLLSLKGKGNSLRNFFTNLSLFLEDAVNVMPNKVTESLENLLDVIVLVLSQLSKTHAELLDITKVYEKLQKDFSIIKERWAISKRTKSIAPEGEPPDDFRTLSLYPTAKDLIEKNFLRKNIVEGRYEDMEHYLDVQFRLLREDFIDPLRVGIKQFRDSLESTAKNKNFNIRIYKNVRFQQIKYDLNKVNDISFLVQLDEKFASRVRWNYSKRLLFGSLLLFTVDNFNTFQLATVSDRDITYLTKGLFSVSLVGNNIFNNEIWTHTFLMAESKVFFTPVYQTLKTIIELPPDELPMEKYLLVHDTASQKPNYIPDGKDIVINKKVIFVDDDASWPPCESMGFNESQYSALKAALRNEFVVIQGPPGTGKTYLGLNIVKILLSNFDLTGPILMVCYTNHALDQFLSGLLDVTEDIVRIGGQSKNEALNKYNFKNMKRFRRFHHPSRDRLFIDMKNCVENIAELNEIKDSLKNPVGIVNLYNFKYTKLKYCDTFESSADFFHWILEEYAEYLNYLFNEYHASEKHVETNASQNALNKLIAFSDNEEDEEDAFRRNMAESWNLNFDIKTTVTAEPGITYLITYNKLNQISSYLQEYLFKLHDQGASDDEKQFIVNDISMIQNILIHIKNKVENVNQKPSNKFSVLLKTNKWCLKEDDRWALYHYWLREIDHSVSEQLFEKYEAYRILQKSFKELQVMEDYNILLGEKPKIVGITTTGAAMHHTLLNAVNPPIIIVEEAAEVLEAHVLVSLTKSCQHLILIGDHKQLRPNPSTFKLAKNYHLDISLFERMLNNGVGCNMLKVQHRMKPNIASLIVPTIYSDLDNHNSVLTYPPIQGIVKNLFFINHQNHEQTDEDLESKSNRHEARFVIALCRHLILQGYQPSEITILTTYASQQFLLRDLKKKESILMDVRMTVVDNYQGEENNIILLSLVRSNVEGKIGFLGIENRICVALSRAKHGFYIIGNMDMLKEKSSIWNTINNTLLSQQAIGDSLSLVCQVHNLVTQVKSADDFKNVIEGGCSSLCMRPMPCGHICKSLCHVIDPDHKGFKCVQPCTRIICDEEGHCCPLQCYETCQPCKIMMVRLLPQCNHEAKIMCHLNPATYKCKTMVKDVKGDCLHEVERYCFMSIDNVRCPTPCNIRLNCGHSCVLNCHVKSDPEHLDYKCMKDCAKKNAGCKRDHICTKRCWEECGLCRMEVKQTLVCGHTHKLVCSQDPANFVCKRKCILKLPCGHPCKQLCFEKCGKCTEKVEKTISECGHAIKVECWVTPTRAMCRKACTKKLSCGHQCMLKCSQECDKFECKELVPSPIPPACGHPGQVLCYKKSKYTDGSEDELLQYCQYPCRMELPCKDKCRGTCGLCMQGRIHQVCQAQCGNILICGHKCGVPCREDCPPCNQKCLYKCSHSICGRKCGTPCVSCKEKCAWNCKHMKCSKLCGQLCDRNPCYEACDKVLKCGHPCVGFCGEPCPILCRICDQEKLCEPFFGTEDEDDARFVVLNDCGHIVESSGLDRWMNLEPEEGKDEEIGLKGCPQCKTPIITTLRYGNKIKNIFYLVQQVKRKIFGNKSDIEVLKRDLVVTYVPPLLNLFEQLPAWARGNRKLNGTLIEEMKQYVPTKNKLHCGINRLKLDKYLSILLIDLFDSCSQLSELNINEGETSVQLRGKIKQRFDLLVNHLSGRKDKISQAEISQFRSELLRFRRIVEFFKVACGKSSAIMSRTTVIESFNKISSNLFSIRPYDNDSDVVQAIKDFATRALHSWYEPVTSEEKKLIQKAMEKNFHSASKQGHWFTCSNGHLYTITECGGAMETGVCPECKEEIGGRNHTLIGTSRLDSTMDGARHAAWSNVQNMHNFQF